MNKIRRIRHLIFSAIFAGFVSLVLPGNAFAEFAEVERPLDEVITTTGTQLVLGASVLLLLLVAIAFKMKHKSESAKKLLFVAITGTALLTTFYLAASTVYLNVNSSSKGPVHWHADFEVWACGQELNLRDPKGWSNKIGTATFHEHNDKRIHVEGVVLEPQDVSLSNFFRVIGGELTQGTLSVPDEDGTQTFTNGDVCPDTNEAGEVQVFVYKTDGSTYYQEKLLNFEEYILSPYGTVPNGDCVVVEFGTPKMQTDTLCKSYTVAEQIGKIKRM